MQATHRVCQRLDVTVPNDNAMVDHDKLDDKLEDVGEREVGNVGHAWLEEVFEKVVDSGDRGADVLVRENDALGRAGGAGRVHDAADVCHPTQMSATCTCPAEWTRFGTYHPASGASARGSPSCRAP